MRSASGVSSTVQLRRSHGRIVAREQRGAWPPLELVAHESAGFVGAKVVAGDGHLLAPGRQVPADMTRFAAGKPALLGGVQPFAGQRQMRYAQHAIQKQ